MAKANHDQHIVDEMSRSFVYLVSPRGGDSFYARVLNTCEKVRDDTMPTLGVALTDRGHFVLQYNKQFFDNLTFPLKKLVLVHEAGHIVLRHHERLFRLLAAVTDTNLRIAVMAIFNWAADFAVNDTLVRGEKEWETQKPWEDNEDLLKKLRAGDSLPKEIWAWLLPEHFGFEKGKSFEYYLKALAKDAEKLFEALQKMPSFGGEDDDEGEDGDAGEGEGEGEGGTGDGEGGGQPGSGKGKPKRRRGKGVTLPGDDRIGVPPELKRLVEQKPELFRKLLEEYCKRVGDSHRDWIKKAQEMPPDEAERMARRLRNRSRQMIRSAYNQTVKGRGNLPGYLVGMIKNFLKDDQVPWDRVFQDIVAAQVCSKLQEAVGPPNLAMLNDENYLPHPGYTLDFVYNVIWVDDTSGSMSDKEVARGRAVMNSLMASNNSIKLRNIQVDATIQHEEDTTNLDTPYDFKEYERHGYGGTVYSPAFRRILGLDTKEDWHPQAKQCDEPPPRPDLVVVVTDGGVILEGEVFPQYKPECPIIWLVTPSGHPAPGMSNVPPDVVIEMHEISED